MRGVKSSAGRGNRLGGTPTSASRGRGMADSSWIAKSGQMWKMHVFYGLMAATIGLIGVFIAAVNGVQVLPELGQFSLAMLFVGAAFAAFMWLGYSIRCPQCGERAAWSTIKKSNASEWLPDLLSLTVCPACHDES